MRFLLSITFLILTGIGALAAPIQYELVKAASTLGFSYVFDGNIFRGEFMSYDADVRIDFDQVANSSVRVTLDVTKAKGGFAFGTQAMRSGKILNAKEFPEILFQSTRVTGGGNKATIDGQITVRGETKPITLSATLFRPKGSDPSVRDNLSLKITGQINRHDFDASGYRDIVDDLLTIDFDTKIKRK